MCVGSETACLLAHYLANLKLWFEVSDGALPGSSAIILEAHCACHRVQAC